LAPDPGRWHESRGYQLITAAIVCPILPAIFTALRIYTRLVLIKKRFWEDFSIVVALVWQSLPVQPALCRMLLVTVGVAKRMLTCVQVCTVLMSVTNGLGVLIHCQLRWEPSPA
jgi:hypothetical protein